MKKVVIFLCGMLAVLIIGGCSSKTASSVTVSEQSFVGTWTGTDTKTNAIVTVIIALANPAQPAGATTANVNISVPNPAAPASPYATTPPVLAPRFVLDSAGEYDFFLANTPAGNNSSFADVYVNPIDTTGAMNFQFTIVGPDGLTTIIGPVGITLNRTSST